MNNTKHVAVQMSGRNWKNLVEVANPRVGKVHLNLGGIYACGMPVYPSDIQTSSQVTCKRCLGVYMGVSK